MKRPLSVIFVALLSIFLAVCGLLSLGWLLLNPEEFEWYVQILKDRGPLTLPPRAHLLLMSGLSVIQLISAIYLLRARNWARVTQLLIWTYGIVSSIARFGASSISLAPLLIFMLILYSLNNAKAQEYFRK